MKIKIIFVLFLFFFFAVTYSQEVKKSVKIETIKGEDYYIHIVKKSETVWKIAKAYDVAPKDIISVNEQANEDIKPGQKLKIPVKKCGIKTSIEFINHTVKKKESLYSIAKNYGVSVDEIKKANSGLTEKINQGQIIKIPVKSEKIKQIAVTLKDTAAFKIDSSRNNYCNPKKNFTYNIALMFPFYLDNTYQIRLDDPDIKDKDADDYISFTFIQYYEGILMAVDSLKKTGFNANIYIYDVDEDTNVTIKILKMPELLKMHLIIGPFFENSMALVAKFAKNHNIKIVEPLSANDDILLGNSCVFKTLPSVNTQLEQLAAYIVSRYLNSSIIIVHNNKDSEKDNASVFKTALNNEFKKTGKAENSFKEIIYNTYGISGIMQNFSNTDTNIVVTLANGEVFVTNYVRKFNDIYDKYKIVVFGLPSWKNFDNIETEYMQNIHLHLFSSSFIDYTDVNVKKFISKFRERYKTEPDNYAFQGFDVAMFFFKALKDYGINFEKCIDKINKVYLQNNYNFVKIGKNNGFENSYLNIYRYENYRFVDVRKHPKIINLDKE